MLGCCRALSPLPCRVVECREMEGSPDGKPKGTQTPVAWSACDCVSGKMGRISIIGVYVPYCPAAAEIFKFFKSTTRTL